MADLEAQTPPVEPQAPQAPASPQAPPQETPKGPAVVTLKSDELAKRLAEAKASALKETLKSLGYEDVSSLQARLQAAKAVEDAQLTEQERAKKELDELRPMATRASELIDRVQRMAEMELKSLPESLRNVVEQLSDDPEDRLDMIMKFRENGVLDALSVKQPDIRPPANSGPPANAPKQGQERSAYDRFVELEASNPLLAGAFYNLNKREVERSRPS